MLCFIYKSPKREGLYLYIKNKDDFSQIPIHLFDSIGEPQFVMELELSPSRTLAREDPVKVIQQIRSKGFFLQMPPVSLAMPDKVQ